MELAGWWGDVQLDALGLHVVDRHRVACPRPLIRTELVEIKRHVTPVAGQHSALDLIGIEHLLCLGSGAEEQHGEAEQQASAAQARDIDSERFEVERENSVSSSDRELKAMIAFSTMGKKHTRKTMITLGSSPKPSHEMKSGAKAIFGTISMQTMNG